MQQRISTREHSLQLMYETHELLILPERFLEIRSLLSQIHASANALAHIVETDVMISASLLKIANSLSNIRGWVETSEILQPLLKEMIA
ncbi:MAG: HDOD domain-containing protein [Mariprofundaceae bacterium]|nr:HDOD domain-containing protein [Mariprofundaceae bacterium]